jgi:hypothetical protein
VRARASTAFLTGALLLLVAACGGGGEDADDPASAGPSSTGGSSPGAATPDEGFEVASVDGGALLTIPAGALPESVAPASISVAPLARKPDSDSDDVVAAYRLEPSGTVFQTPVLLTFEATLPPNHGLLALLLSEDGFEQLPFELSSSGDRGDSATLSIELSHFSDLLVLAAQNTDYGIDARITLPTEFDHVVGVPFTLRTAIELSDFENAWDDFYSYTGADGRTQFADRVMRDRPRDGRWLVGVELDVVGPVAAIPAAAGREAATADSHSVDRQLVCASIGDYTIGVLVEVDRRVTRQIINLGGPKQGEVEVVRNNNPDGQTWRVKLRLGIQGRCIASPPTGSATSPPPPPSTPAPGGGNEVTVGPAGPTPVGPGGSDSSGGGAEPPGPPAGPPSLGSDPSGCAGYVAPIGTCNGPPSVSMTTPVEGQPSTVTITSAPNTSFLKITCHQPAGGAESCSAFQLETGPDGSFSGQTEMLMGPGVWSEFVCLPASKCTEEFPSFSDLRAFGEGCRNGVCVGVAVATVE